MVQKVSKKLLLMVTATLMMVMLFGMTTFAAGEIKNLKQTGSNTTAVDLEWDAILGVSQYKVYFSENGIAWTDMGTAYGASKYVYNLTSGHLYYVKVTTTDGLQTSNVIKVVTKPDTVKNLKQTGATDKTVTMSWDAAPGAEYYNVYYYNSYDNLTFIGKTTATSYKVTGLKTDATYSLAVKAVKTSGTYIAEAGYAYEYLGFETLPGKITTLASERYALNYAYLKNKYARIDLEWDRKNNADGYQVQICDYKKPSKVKKTLNVTYNNANWPKAAKNGIYAVRIRAYTKINAKKVYSGWSKYTYIVYQPDIKDAKISGGKLKVSWNKVTGATSYDVYVSNKSKITTYTRVAKNVKKTSTTIAKYKNKKFASRKYYYVYVIANYKKGKTTYKADPYWYESIWKY